MGNPDEWLETVRKCEYLPEQDIKKLCEMVTQKFELEDGLCVARTICHLTNSVHLQSQP